MFEVASIAPGDPIKRYRMPSEGDTPLYAGHGELRIREADEHQANKKSGLFGEPDFIEFAWMGEDGLEGEALSPVNMLPPTSFRLEHRVAIPFFRHRHAASDLVRVYIRNPKLAGPIFAVPV
jgi:hypothetical protein